MSGFSIKISDGRVDFAHCLKPDYDNIVLDDQDFLLVIEGLILNKLDLIRGFASKDFTSLLKILLSKRNIPSVLEGEFRGFFFEKKKQELCVFTNPTATQKVFYSKRYGELYIDTDLVRLNNSLKKNGTTNPDIDAIYQLLAVGNMLEDTTPIQNIFKLLDGHILCTDLSANYTIKSYFSAIPESRFRGNQQVAIDNINAIFDKSVEWEYNKDLELGGGHLALLSGGLDSRIALFSALRQGFLPDVFCFSQSGYYDEKISRKIAREKNLSYEFVSLDGGQFLTRIDEIVRIGGGCTIFSGAPHVYHAIEQQQNNGFKIFHSGQIGDGVLGGFNSVPAPAKPSYCKIISDYTFLPKIDQELKDIFKNYDSEEAFLLRNIAFNRTVLGAEVFKQKALQTSPFMSRDFLTAALALPESWKYGHRFYLNWIESHFKEARKFRWERTLMKPDAAWKIGVGDKVVKRAQKLFFMKLLKIPRLASMYPYQIYFEHNIGIQKYYKSYFDKNIHRLSDYPELAGDIIKLFSSNDFSSKARALHILAVFKLFFDEGA